MKIGIILFIILLLFISGCDLKNSKEANQNKEDNPPFQNTDVTNIKDLDKSLTCGECQYLENGICKNYNCCDNIICDDINPNTNDICINPKTPNSYCFHNNSFSNICGNKVCSQYQECINQKCVLKNQNLKFGLVYVYYNQDTYESNWREEFEPIKNKFIYGLSQITNNKVSTTLDILGEVQTSIFCWNPSELGITWINSANPDDVFFRPLSGSSFTEFGWVVAPGQTIIGSSCTNCEYIINEFNQTVYQLSCPSPLSYYNLFQTNKIQDLNQQISSELSVNFSNYNGVFMIFGKLGGPAGASTKDPLFDEYKCRTMAGSIVGYSNLIMAEEAIIEPVRQDEYLVNCSWLGDYSPYGYSMYGHYIRVGWHTMVHEILHWFGAVDIYNTGFSFGIDTSYRNQALSIDSRANESIMGDDQKSCMEEGGTETNGDICATEELEDIYLDLLNRQFIGLE